MLTRVIKRYFLRMYAAELGRRRGFAGLGPFGEAILQTVLITIFPVVGLGAAVGILLLESSFHDTMIEYRPAVTAGFAIVPLTVAYIFVRSVVSEYRNRPQAAAPFATRRDRIVRNLQFWCVFLVSLAFPIGVAVVTNMTR